MINNISQPSSPSIFEIEVGRGTFDNFFAVNKFARATDVDKNTNTDIWDRSNATDTQVVWTAPTQSRIHKIASSSINDTSVDGGAKTIRVYGLPDWDTPEISEVITMNGTTDVPTVFPYVIIHRMEVVTKGEDSVNSGIITATADIDNTVTAQINQDEGQTQMSVYGIPSTHDFYMMQFYASVNKSPGQQPVEIIIKVLYNPEPQDELINFITKHTSGKHSRGTSDGGSHTFRPPKKFEGPGIIKMSADSDTDGTDVSAGFDGFLVPKN